MAPTGCATGAPAVFSTATTGVGWTAVIVVVLYMVYSAWRITCCCARRKAAAGPDAARGACDVPLHIHPLLALFGSVRYARAGGAAADALCVGDCVQVACYEHGSGWAAVPVRLRLVASHGHGAATELDAPADVAGWSAALAGRLHPGLFRVTGVEASMYTLAAATDPTRLLQHASPIAPAGWSTQFHATLLTRAAACDAPQSARGFAGRPLRRVVAGLLLEGLGGWAAASVEVSMASAAWQATCRTWWQRVLTRGVSAAILIAGAEYACTVVVPIAVERLGRWVATRGAVALTLPLAGFGIWSLCVNGAAGGPALGSAIVVWLWAVLLSHALFWPLLLLLSAGVWRDVAPLPEERWEAGGAAAQPPQPRKSRDAQRSAAELAAVTVATPPPVMAPPPPPPAPSRQQADPDNPFAYPTASAWGDAGARGPVRNTQHGAW